ncbi:MAG TPA: DUF2613 family protein [Candidatus Nanopelagicales bacterium]|nr:DUF2613 family protein [Candidatus Nanopelagicales bacterium]
MGVIIAAIIGFVLAVVTAFGLVTMTTNASAPSPDQPSDASVIVYGTSS